MVQARRWHRPYSHPELWVVAVATVLLCGLGVTLALAGGMSGIAAAAIAVIAIALAVRVVHTGLFVGPTGVQIRTMWRTATYEWFQIADSWARSRTKIGRHPAASPG